MKILFAFENPLPSPEADAEVFLTTARYLSVHVRRAWLHVPAKDDDSRDRLSNELKMPVVRALAPVRPAALRHFLCGFTLVLHREFREADLIYTRNLWVAWISILFRQRVVFDHYRPWPDQIPPLRLWIYRLFCHPRFLVNICHSEYTRGIYASLGIPPEKLRCVRNGFEPRRLQAPVDIAAAKRTLGIDPAVKTVVYTGRVNHKKGLAVAVEAARQLPDILFLLVGSRGEGPIEKLAEAVHNVRVVGWQSSEALAGYIFAADVLLIPPSAQPLATFGSTVLPLKLFLYLASGRPIVAGDTPDVREVLEHDRNAYLCPPDRADRLAAAISLVTSDDALAERLSAAAKADSLGFTWSARAEQIARIVEARLSSSTVAATGSWDRHHFREWRRQSWRWLRHLIRQRTWVLPPQSLPVDRRVRNASVDPRV